MTMKKKQKTTMTTKMKMNSGWKSGDYKNETGRRESHRCYCSQCLALAFTSTSLSKMKTAATVMIIILFVQYLCSNEVKR